jgi:hypothetical protein
MPAKDVNELIAWLKANPNKASAGISATSVRLAGDCANEPITAGAQRILWAHPHPYPDNARANLIASSMA